MEFNEISKRLSQRYYKPGRRESLEEFREAESALFKEFMGDLIAAFTSDVSIPRKQAKRIVRKICFTDSSNSSSKRVNYNRVFYSVKKRAESIRESLT